MKTTTLPDTQDALAQQEGDDLAAAGELLLVPLSRLRPSSRKNVRKGKGTSIPELAASILRVRLLQNLIVTRTDGETYEVVGGKRRLAAMRLLVKRGKLDKDFEVPCLLVPDADARTASLTENVQREAMHPADQFEAFAALVADGRPVEDIAADFGVTPLVVQRRLRLANVSPRLLADYRADAVTLDQLMALAITDDHAAQETAFYESPQWQRAPQALREHLTSREIDASSDGPAKLVGLAAYEAAGGAVRRDLFADDRQGAYLTDAALLDRLARERLAALAEQVRAEGWLWVDVAPRLTPAELHAFQRARRDRRAPNKAEAKRIAKLRERQEAIEERLEGEDAGDLPEDETQALYEESDALGAELEAIDETLQVYPAEALALAGAVVTVDRAGAATVHRGLVREAEAKAHKTQARSSGRRDGNGEGHGEEAASEAGGSGISERLARRLSAHRTAALQAEVARHPHIALVALVHALALRVVCDSYMAESPLNISATPQFGLQTDAPDIEESPALVGLREVRQAWAARLPQEPDALFAELLAQPQAELLALLAVCVATTVGAVTSRADAQPAGTLAHAVGLDMHAWWTPSADGYFAHVPKAKTLEAVQAFAPGEVTRLAKLKKDELASEAGRLAQGTGWLPAMLAAIGPVPQEPSQPKATAGGTADGAPGAAAVDADAEAAVAA